MMTEKQAGLLGCGIICFQLLACGGVAAIGSSYLKSTPAVVQADKTTAPTTEATPSPESATPTPAPPPPPPPEPTPPPPPPEPKTAPPPPPRFEPNKVPADQQLGELITAIFLDMDHAFKTQDVKPLQQRMAQPYQGPEGEQRLRKTAKFFAKTSFAHLKGLVPNFTKRPFLNGQGQLVAEGRYTANPPVSFEFTFNFENGEWKLAGHSFQSGGDG